jgi:hypothetical protein
MKKGLLIFFCLQILSGNTFAMEIMKIPGLVHHYFEHESKDHPDESFYAFLSEHYFYNDHNEDSDGHCDDKLPFKHCNDCGHHSTVISLFLIPQKISFTVHEDQSEKENFSFYKESISIYNGHIWQPPKLV